MDASAMNTAQPWQLEPPSSRSRLGLALVVLAAPLLSLVVVPALVPGGDPRDAWALAGVCGLCIVIAVALDWGMRRHRVAIQDGTLDLTTSFYRRRMALTELRLDEARVVDLSERTELRPGLKSNGFNWIGFRSGWFRARQGRMLVATAGGDRVLWVPTTRGFDLLLQPRRPQALLERLRELAAGAPRR